jgi:mRNA-degrading endonuclease toxin of MazEF toxin-antitoxin module
MIERGGIYWADLTDHVGHVPPALLHEVDRSLRRVLDL